jgi:hypothetical protein
MSICGRKGCPVSEPTDAQLHTLRHMLGINTPHDREPNPHRDYAAVNPGDREFAELERIGAVRCYRRAGAGGYGDRYDWFCCTPEGKAAAMASHKRIRYSKAARRYIKFLDVRDCWPGLTFRQFLTLPELADARRDA